MIITKVTEKFMISSSRIVNITLDSKEDEKQCVVSFKGSSALKALTSLMMIYEVETFDTDSKFSGQRTKAKIHNHALTK